MSTLTNLTTELSDLKLDLATDLSHLNTDSPNLDTELTDLNTARSNPELDLARDLLNLEMASATPAASSPPLSFFDLPNEVRNKVYVEYFLDTGIQRRPKSPERKKRVVGMACMRLGKWTMNLGLLVVSRKFGSELESLFFGTQRLNIKIARHSVTMGDPYSIHHPAQFWPKYRKVAITFEVGGEQSCMGHKDNHKALVIADTIDLLINNLPKLEDLEIKIVVYSNLQRGLFMSLFHTNDVLTDCPAYAAFQGKKTISVVPPDPWPS